MDESFSLTTLHLGADRPIIFECGAASSDAPMLPLRFSAKNRRNEIWAWYKEAIRDMYMSQDATLSQTMNRFQQRGLIACTRTWKMKLKEWGFEKYRSEADMGKLLARHETRNSDEGTPVEMAYKSLAIGPENINFKRRRSALGTVNPPSIRTKKARKVTSNRGTKTKRHHQSQQRSNSQSKRSPIISSLNHKPKIQGKDQSSFIEKFAEFPILARGDGTFLRFVGDLNINLDNETPSSLEALWEMHQHKQRPLISLSKEFKGEKEWKRFDLILRLESLIITIEFSKAEQPELAIACTEFLDFLESNLTIFPRRDTEVSFEKILKMLQNMLGPDAVATVRMSEMLADFQFLCHPGSPAISALYNSVIKGFQGLEQWDDVFRCQLSLADILYTQGSVEDSLLLFVESLSEYIRLHLGSWIIHKAPRACYELELRRSRPYNLYFTNTVWRRLRNIKRVVCCKSRGSKTQDDLDNGKLYTEVLHLAADVGDLLSGILEIRSSTRLQQSIEALFSAVIPKLENLGDEEFGELKVYAYLARSSHHLNTGSWALCLDDILRCHQYLLQTQYYDKVGLLLGPSHYFDTFQERIFHDSIILDVELIEYAAALNTIFTEFRWPNFCNTEDFVLDEPESVLDLCDNDYILEHQGETTAQLEGESSGGDVPREMNPPIFHSLERIYKIISRTQSIVSTRSHDSNNYGITYSDGASVMSGVSFNYSPLFITS